MKKEEYNNKIIEKCHVNHIWLNKLTYISPSDADKIALADMILAKLNNKGTQLPSSLVTEESEQLQKIAELTPILYLSINWS